MLPKYKSNFRFISICLILLFSGRLNAQVVKSRKLSQNINVDALLYHEGGTLFGSGGWNDSRIYKIQPDGEVSLHANVSSGVVDMVWGVNDTIIGSVYQSGWLVKIAPDGKYKNFVHLSTGLASLYKNYDGDVLCTINPGLVSSSAGSVKMVKPDGLIRNFASGGSINKPSGVTQDEEGNYYISNLGDGRITIVTPDGTKELFATVPATGKWKIGYIKYWKGALYTSAISENKIYKTTLDGEVSVYTGTGTYSNIDGPLESATIKEPNGMAVAGDTLFIISGINATNKLRFITDQTTEADNRTGVLPDRYLLEPNFPNPFNPSTTIGFTIPEFSDVKLKVYNTLGQEITTLVNEPLAAGSYNVSFSADDLTSGIYLYTIQTGRFTDCKKMIRMR